jgi:hypothetical protein
MFIPSADIFHDFAKQGCISDVPGLLPFRARSAMASKIMHEIGFQHIINMTGGYTEWLAKGLPVVK